MLVVALYLTIGMLFAAYAWKELHGPPVTDPDGRALQTMIQGLPERSRLILAALLTMTWPWYVAAIAKDLVVWLWRRLQPVRRSTRAYNGRKFRDRRYRFRKATSDR